MMKHMTENFFDDAPKYGVMMLLILTALAAIVAMAVHHPLFTGLFFGLFAATLAAGVAINGIRLLASRIKTQMTDADPSSDPVNLPCPNPDTKYWLSWRQILGAVAQWSVRLLGSDCNIPHPPNLEDVIELLAIRLRPHFDGNGYARLSIRDVRGMLQKNLMKDPLFLNWNNAKVIPKHWLDLDALILSVCHTIRLEEEANIALHAK